MTTFNLTCEAVEATLPDYLDGTLEGWVRESIEEHLGGCARCTGFVRGLRNIAREAAALPALVPERDPWSRIADRIGVPAIVSEPPAEIAPLPPAAEPIVLASEASLPIEEPSAVASEPPVVTIEPPVLATATPVVTTEPPVVTTEAPVLTDEPVLVASEVSPPPNEPLSPPIEPTLPPVKARVPRPAPAYAFSGRREKPLSPRWMGLARAAALVVVTAGTTFLLTVQWLGPARAPNVARDASTRTRSPTEKPSAGLGIRAPSAGRQQVVLDSIPTPRPGQLASALTVSATSAAEVTPSPEDAVYDKEINKLQRIVRRQKSGLDTSTVTVIDKNLRTLDSAIGQIRAALKKDPGSSLLGGQASRALEMKVELLRRTAMLRSNTT
jgi:hypothetical protein